MSDAIQSAILAAFSSALERAISQAVAIHVQDLQARLDALTDRVAALESQPAGTPATITADAFVTHLDNQEWFWEKLQNRIDAATEAAMDAHAGTYDHDDYDQISSSLSNIDLDDLVTNSNIKDAVNDVLKNATVSIRI